MKDGRRTTLCTLYIQLLYCKYKGKGIGFKAQNLLLRKLNGKLGKIHLNRILSVL